MVYVATPDLINALHGNHEMVCRVDLFDSDGLRAVDVPIETGSITASLLADVSRSGTLTVSQRLIDQGLFDPMWDKVRISTGVRGYPLIPIFTGRVQDNTINDDGSVDVAVDDFGDDLVNAPFEKPWVVQPGQSVLATMSAIIRDVDQDFTVDFTTTPDGITPSLSWSDNRPGALDELATSINAIWQTARSGGFLIYPNPYRLAVTPPPVLSLSDGPGGSLTLFKEVRSRKEVYNSVTLEVQRADGGDPIRAVVRDMRDRSRTKWGGPFGKRNRRISVQAPYSLGEARAIASRILGQSLALARSWQLSTPHFPILDPGDIIAVTYRGVLSVQVIESIIYPLLAIGETQLSTRELILFNDNPEDQSPGTYYNPQEPK